MVVMYVLSPRVFDRKDGCFRSKTLVISIENTGIFDRKNRIETNRSKSKQIEANRNKSKQIEANRNKSKQIETNRSKSKQIEANHPMDVFVELCEVNGIKF